MTIEEFLRARWLETVNNASRLLPPTEAGGATYSAVAKLVDQLEGLLNWHAHWPVLAEGPAEFEQGSDGIDFNTLYMQMTQKIEVFTRDAFKERFGEEPPASMLIRAMANEYKDHPDFQEEWLL